MEKKIYEVLTDNFPRRAPAGVGAKLELYEVEAKYAVLSGDLKVFGDTTETPPAETPPAKKGKKPDAASDSDGEGEGA